ncbi:MAG: hypothetical protein AVDCRST_MAG50-2144, partial [uncultured Acidimicrobiales bacterium]
WTAPACAPVPAAGRQPWPPSPFTTSTARCGWTTWTRSPIPRATTSASATPSTKACRSAGCSTTGGRRSSPSAPRWPP